MRLRIVKSFHGIWKLSCILCLFFHFNPSFSQESAELNLIKIILVTINFLVISISNLSKNNLKWHEFEQLLCIHISQNMSLSVLNSPLNWKNGMVLIWDWGVQNLFLCWRCGCHVITLVLVHRSQYTSAGNFLFSVNIYKYSLRTGSPVLSPVFPCSLHAPCSKQSAWPKSVRKIVG